MLRVSQVKVSGQIENVINPSDVKPAVNSGIREGAQWQSSLFYTQTILPLKNAVAAYTEEFDNAVDLYMRDNSVLRKMKNSLNTNIRDSSPIEKFSRGKYQNNKRSTQNLMTTMLRGHSLLLQVRQSLTGQEINTKFIIQAEGRFYQIDESRIDPNLVLSRFGGGTVSNPFSLAYSIDLDMLKARELLKEENDITDTDIWQTIGRLKPDYLQWKKQQWAAKGVKREYKNIFFDSKDAEIYELYTQQTGNIPELSLSEYIKLRAEMGGGGGYATAFYKLGDIGSTQVKYFNLEKNQKSSTVNFARFSLLRDRLRQLRDILSNASPEVMKNELIAFFTEKDELVSQQVSREFNRIAKQAIEKLFSDLS